MIRQLNKTDFEDVIKIVNDNWQSVYSGYVNPNLLYELGCRERAEQLKSDFISRRLSEYVWVENDKVCALLSVGETADADRIGDFEVWRLYVAAEMQGKKIGGQLLDFAEQKAKNNGYNQIVIWSFSENKRAVDFYKKHGYKIDKTEFLNEPYFAYGTRLLKTII